MTDFFYYGVPINRIYFTENEQKDIVDYRFIQYGKIQNNKKVDGVDWETPKRIHDLKGENKDENNVLKVLEDPNYDWVTGWWNKKHYAYVIPYQVEHDWSSQRYRLNTSQWLDHKWKSQCDVFRIIGLIKL